MIIPVIESHPSSNRWLLVPWRLRLQTGSVGSNPSDLVTLTAPPDNLLESICSLALDGVRSIHTRRAYEHALFHFLVWLRAQSGSQFSKAFVQRYRSELETRDLAPATVNLRLSAVRKLAAEAADNGLLPRDTAAAISRVRGVARRGTRLGHWLTASQARTLIESVSPGTLAGKRDRAMLAFLITAGLRRSELVELNFDNVRLAENRWVIADLVGKGGRVRTIPIPFWAKCWLDEWTSAAKLTDGPLFRSVSKAGTTGKTRLTPQTVLNVVKRHAGLAGVELAPHDLRRTYARLAHNGRATMEQIQLTLGHSSIATTERYLNVQLDLADAPCDHIGIVASASQPPSTSG